ncbi:hypothetical protein FCV25MIE_33633 [Fagus crenata]
MLLNSPYNHIRPSHVASQSVATLCYINTGLAMSSLACQLKPDVRQSLVPCQQKFYSHISNHMFLNFQRLVQLMPSITETQVQFGYFASTRDATVHQHISVLAL